MFKYVVACTLLAAACSALPQQYPQQQSRDAAAQILRQSSEQNPDGSYSYSYETDNGLSAQEAGQQKQIGAEAGTVAQGSFSFTLPDGQQVQVQYVADENGFQPQGAHLPTPPPIPEAILRSLEYNAAHPEPEQLPQRQSFVG